MLTHTNTQNTLWRAWPLSGLGFGATRVCVGVVALVPELAWIVCVRQQNPDPARAHFVVVGSEQTRVFLGTSF